MYREVVGELTKHITDLRKQILIYLETDGGEALDDHTAVDMVRRVHRIADIHGQVAVWGVV